MTRPCSSPSSADLIVHTLRPMEKAELIWKSGEFVPWDEANVHVLTHGLHYGTGVFEGIRCYETEIGSGDLPPPGAPDRLAKLGRALLPAARPRARGDPRGDQGADPAQRAAQLLHPPDRVPRATARWASTPRARRSTGDRRLALGRVPRRGGQEARHPREGLVLAPDLARRPDPAREGVRAVPELDPRQDRARSTPATTRRSCSTIAASSARAPARTSSSSATARS